MSKKKILFIIQSYPSERSANVLCDEKIMLELIKNNIYDIHVLCYRYNFQCKEEKINGINVHRFSRGLLWNLYTWARYQKNNFKIKLIFFIDKILLRIKEFLTIPIFPIYQPFAILLYYYHAYLLMKKEKFDFVVAEHNGLDTLITGYLLKKKFPKVKFMPIFWDALSVGIPVKYLPYWYSQCKRIKLEKKVLQVADKVIVMQSHEQKLKDLYFNTPLWNKIKALDLPSFIKKEKTIENIKKSSTINFCFAGSLANRNIELLASILAKINLENIKLLVVAQELYRPRINKLLKKCPNLNIHFQSYLPHEELLKLFEEVDVFVNLGVDSNTMVASKIFEYMSFCKPIIATYRRSDDANIPYLKKYPISFLIDERETDISKQAIALQKFIEENIDKKVSYEEIAPLFYKNTPQAYVEEINKLLKEE